MYVWEHDLTLLDTAAYRCVHMLLLPNFSSLEHFQKKKIKQKLVSTLDNGRNEMFIRHSNTESPKQNKQTSWGMGSREIAWMQSVILFANNSSHQGEAKMHNLKIKIYYPSRCLQIFCTHGSNQLQVKNIFELRLNWTFVVHFLNSAIYTNCLYSTCIWLALYVIRQHLRYGWWYGQILCKCYVV